MNHIAVPKAVFNKYAFLPWSEIHAAAERGDNGLQDAIEKDRALWDAIPDKDPKEKYAYGNHGGTLVRLQGFAILRDGTKDLRRDGACLFFQGW